MTTGNPLYIDSSAVTDEEQIETSTTRTASGELALAYTGERMVPEANRGQLIYIEHLARYMFAARLAEGKRVLDFGSGEGYGASILSNHGAASVSAIDISPLAIDHAQMKYPHHSIDFVCADCLKAPFADDSFDLVTSFEVIEHLTDHAGYIREVRRVLNDEGYLVISTPNIATSSGNNEFHLRELGFDEFVTLLKANFNHVKLFAQTDLISSMVYDPEEKNRASFTLDAIEPLPDISDSSYFLAVCSNGEITLPVGYRCMATVDGEYPRLNNIIRELSANAVKSNKAVEDHIAIIEKQRNEKDEVIDSLIREREELMTVFTRYREMMPHLNEALVALRNDAISVESSLALAQICLAVNIFDSARRFLSQVLRQQPEHTAALFLMGELYYKSGKPGLANEYIKKVLQADLHHPGANALITAIDA
jgi:2-polyprenyl-3-methyl-5-hydroxy-6-metoxy-1,4-benzoquinol methylase